MTSILGSEWNLSSEGINIITENGTIKDNSKILTAALNTDLKEIGSPILVKELTKQNTSKLVLQIQKIRNISAPKANEASQAAPRMLKLILTDGDSHIQAIEISSINSISRNHTPPGTKILINNAKIASGYILLNSNNCSVLGGKVPHLVEKWEIAKSIQRNKRGNTPNDDGPPPWVRFGNKIQTCEQEFKSLGTKNKEAAKENSDFELQRQGAIAEASAGAVRKVFGGRVKQNVQPTMNQNRPNREKQEKGKSKGRFAAKEKDVEEKLVRPSEKVSLFAFLEDKLPLSEPSQSTAKSLSYTENQNYSRNQTSNYNKNYDSQTRPYNNQQNYNRNPIQSRYDRNTQQNINQSNLTNQFDKLQSHNYPRFPNNEKNYGTANNAKQQQSTNYPRYPHNERQDSTPNSAKQEQSSSNPRWPNNEKQDGNTKQHSNNYARYSTNERQDGTTNNTKQQQSNYPRYPNNERQDGATNNTKQQQSNNYPRYPNNEKQDGSVNNTKQQQSNNNPRYTNNEKQDGTTNNAKQQEKPKYQKRNEAASNSKESLDTSNTQKDEVNDLSNNMSKASLNSQFASRSLRQHLNLGPTRKSEEMPKKNDNYQNNSFNIGDECMAKYWEDGKFYNAVITAITDKTYAVRFKGYGNIEEILKTDCSPVNSYNKQNRKYDQNSRPHGGSVEFRRSNRNYK